MTLQTTLQTTLQPVWIAGRWQAEPAPEGELQSYQPKTGEALAPRFPISGDKTLQAALEAGRSAAVALRSVAPERIAQLRESKAIA